MIRFLLFALLSAALFSVAGEPVFLEPGTPLFRTPEINSAPAAIVPDPGMQVEKIGEKLYHIHRNALAHRLRMEEYRLNPQTTIWGCRMMGTEQENGRFVRYFPLRDPLRMTVGTLLVLAAMVCAQQTFRRRNFYLPAIAILLFQWGLMLYISGCVPTLFSHPVDEDQYFRIALDLSHGRLSGVQWNYTVGLPLMYQPFIFFTGAKCFYDIEMPYVIFNAFFLGAFALVLLYFILRKLTGSTGKSLGAVFLFQLLAVFYQYQDQWYDSIEKWGGNIYKSYFAFPTLDFSYNLYTKYTILHYNALSDTLSTVCVLGCIALLLYRKRTLLTLALMSLLFGYACIVRLNNIWFAPLLAFLLFLNFRDRLRSPGFFFRFLGTGAVCFLAVFSLQLVVNRIQFGDFLRFPYYLHAKEVYEGFRWSVFPHGLRFIFSTQYAYFALGLTGLWLIRDRTLRTVLGLWIFPLLFFFAGYPQIGNNVSRFLLTVLMVLPGCVFCSEVFDKASPQQRIAAGAAVFLPLIAAAPSNYTFSRLLQWELQRFENGFLIANGLTVAAALASCALVAVFLRNDRRMLLFAGVFLLLFLSGIWQLLCVSAMVLAGRMGYDLFLLFKSWIQEKKRPERNCV